MTFFEKYVTSNLAPGYSEPGQAVIESLRMNLISQAPELEHIADAILTAVSIGAHRPDMPCLLLELALQPIQDSIEDCQRCFEQFRSTIMIVWTFVGIPWVVPACMGLAHVLDKYDLSKHIAGSSRPPFGDEHVAIGAELLRETYSQVSNSEVQETLRTTFEDFTSLSWAVVFGYCLAGTTRTGVFKKAETQLILAAAITSSGAVRQAKSHLKGAMTLGASPQAVSAVLDAAYEIVMWNQGKPRRLTLTDITTA